MNNLIMGFQGKYMERTKKLTELKTRQLQIKNELQIAYEYRELIISKNRFAEKQIAEKQKEYHNSMLDLLNELNRLKNDLDLEWAGQLL